MNKKIIINVFNYALQKEAKSLIISHNPEKISIEYHLDSGLLETFNLPKKLEKEFFNTLKKVLDIRSKDLINRKYHKIDHHNFHLPVYISVLPDKNQEKIIIDLIQSSPESWSFRQLGLKTKDQKNLKTTLNKKAGLIIIASPARQGKTATLETLLSEINAKDHLVYYLGHKLGRKIKNVNKLKPTLNNWEKLRQHDSEIIFADDLKDDSFLSEAFLTADSGRLVIITLEAKDSKEVLERIKKLKLYPSLIKNTLKIISNQTLETIGRSPSKNTFRTKASRRKLIAKFDLLKL